MDKKILLIGVMLLVVAIVIFFISGYLSTNGVKNNIAVRNFTIKPDSFAYLPITYKSNTSVLAIYAILSQPTNIYLLNQSTFLQWSKYIGANTTASGLKYVESLGVNSSYIQTNQSIAVLPLNAKSVRVANYFEQQTVYIVVDNTPGSKSSASGLNATISSLPLSSSSILGYAALGYGVILLAIAAVIVIIWGVFRKPKVVAMPTTAAPTNNKKLSKEQRDKEYVDRLYKGVKGSKKKDQDE